MASVTTFCRAKDPQTCRYHSAVILMYKAQTDGNLDDYLKYRGVVEDLQNNNWDEASARELFAPTVTNSPSGSANPVPQKSVSTTINLDETIPSTRDEEMQQRNVLRDIIDAPYHQVDATGHRTGKQSTVRFYQHKEGITVAEPAYLRVQANRELTVAEANTLAGLAGYAHKVKVGRDRLGSPQRDTPFSFIVAFPTANANAKNAGENLPQAINDFESQLLNYVAEGGSPVRKKDNQRSVQGLENSDIELRFFYDSVLPVTA